MRRSTTYFCVQAFRWRGDTLELSHLSRFTSATEAEATGELVGRQTAGVLVYAVDGEPEHDIWNEPRLLATHGVVPEFRMQPF